jgi:hypothetical protein
MWLLPYIPLWNYGLDNGQALELKKISEKDHQIYEEEYLQAQILLPDKSCYLLSFRQEATFLDLLEIVSQRSGVCYTTENKYIFYLQKNFAEGVYLRVINRVIESNIRVLVCLFITNN